MSKLAERRCFGAERASDGEGRRHVGLLITVAVEGHADRNSTDVCTPTQQRKTTWART